MKFHSIRTLIATLSGASILAVVAVLLIFALSSSARTQQSDASQTEQLLLEQIKERLIAMARTQAAQIGSEIHQAMTIAEDLARLNGLLAATDEEGNALLATSREELALLLRTTVEQNPELLGAYIG